MKRTQKYIKALELLTFPHNVQDELYNELNRLNWYWNAKSKVWERDDRLAIESNVIKVRVWAKTEIVEEIAEHFIESSTTMGIKFLEKSKPYQCRPPHQNESRVYLTFEDVDPS